MSIQEQLTEKDLKELSIIQEKIYKEKELFSNFATGLPYVKHTSIEKKDDYLVYYITFQHSIKNSVVTSETFHKEVSPPVDYNETYKDLLQEFFKYSHDVDEKYQNGILNYLYSINYKNIISQENISLLIERQYTILRQLTEDYRVFDSYVESL